MFKANHFIRFDFINIFKKKFTIIVVGLLGRRSAPASGAGAERALAAPAQLQRRQVAAESFELSCALAQPNEPVEGVVALVVVVLVLVGEHRVMSSHNSSCSSNSSITTVGKRTVNEVLIEVTYNNRKEKIE